MGSKPSALPTIHRLSANEAGDDLHLFVAVTSSLATPLPDNLLGAYELPRGSIFLPLPGITQPIAFTTRSDRGHSGRAYVVLAREIGDLTWPVWVQRQKVEAAADFKAAAARLRRRLTGLPAPTWAAKREAYVG